MKTKLLRKLRKLNVVYQRNNEYCFVHKRSNSWYNMDVDWSTNWSNNKLNCILERREAILRQAKEIYKPAKKIL